MADTEVVVRFAEGSPSSLVGCRNKKLPWGEFAMQLAKPLRDRVKTKTFLKLSAAEQGRVKGAAGWFVGGPVKNSQRNRKNVEERDLLTFDVDGCAPAVFWSLLDETSPLCRYEWALCTTRKHTEDAPRFRLAMPLKETCPAGLYEPVMRILGAELDPTLDGIDDVTFRASQLMYWPTVGPDTEWVFHRNHGRLVDPETVLAGFGEWRDFANLPYSEKRSKARRRAEKAENPLEKHGIIGAFCRAFDVPRAIAEFLPDVYVPDDSGSSDPRYTYTRGSVAGGAIVYDGGLFLYSHHDTDPAGHQNLNSFDLVRIHKFEHLDAKTGENTPMTQRPSFKAMVEMAREHPEVKRELLEEKIDMAAIFDDVDDLDEQGIEALYEEPPPAEPRSRRAWLPPWPGKNGLPKADPEWKKTLDVGRDGSIKPSLYNVTTILTHDPRLRGAIARNKFTSQLVALRPLRTKIAIVPQIDVPNQVNGLDWLDVHDISIRLLLNAPGGKGNRGYGLNVSMDVVTQAIHAVSESFAFNPLCNLLADLPAWNGTKRAETFFIDYFGCPDTPYHRQVARQWLLGAVARAFHPGHKFDFVPVLSSAEGKRKSTFTKTLTFDYGGEFTAEMSANKDAVEQMAAGGWILEMGELSSMNRSEVESVKAFLSRTVDFVRLAYERRARPFPRKCVFYATSNDFEYLKARENRRFWPITVRSHDIDIRRLKREREQIWAEVMEWYRAMLEAGHDYQNLPFGLEGEAKEEALRRQEAARVETADDQDAAVIEQWLNTPVPLSQVMNGHFHDEKGDPLVVRTKTCAAEIAEKVLGERHPGRAGRAAKNLAAKAIGEMFRSPDLSATWSKWSDISDSASGKLRFAEYGNQRAYIRLDATPEERSTGYRIISEG